MSNHNNNKFNILLFWFADDWGQFGRAYERVAENLAKLPEVNHVVCMFPPVSAAKHNLKSTLRIKSISEKLTLVTETDYKPLRVDANFSRIRNFINNRYSLHSLHKYLRKIGFDQENTVLWLFPPHPYIEHILNVIPHRFVISHIIDDFSKFDPSHELYSFAKSQYPKLAQWSDTTITTSEANHLKFSELTGSCHMFWPAVDDSFIGQPQSLPFKSTGAAPRLGYVGWIMDRTDLDLMKHIAQQRPQWQLVLAGPQYPKDYLDQSGLLTFPNVEYLGPLPQTDVPEFLWSLDVCLMPHRDNEYTRSMGPLKLYQYLASGRPVVSTNVAGLERVHDHILIASDKEEFINHIEEALEFDTIEKSTNRIHLARQNTWSVRVREMFDAILKDT